MMDAALQSPDDRWTDTDENLAQLIDLLDYWLSTEYAGWVTDPDDPEVKRRREERRRSGITPPPIPILPIVGHRPPGARSRAQERADTIRKHFETPPPLEAPDGSKISILNAALGG